MDTSDHNQSQETMPPPSQPALTPQTPPPVVPQTVKPVQQPTAPRSGGGGKEQGPIASGSPVTETQEKPVEVSSEDIPVSSQPHEVPVSAELKEIGVDQGSDAQTDVLAEELKENGVELAKESTPFPTGDTTNVALPPYDEVLKAEEKKLGFKDALRWLIQRWKFEWKRSNQKTDTL